MVHYKKIIYLILVMLITLIGIFSLSLGEYDITFKNTILALLNKGNEQDINIVLNVRLPRFVSGFLVGSTLAVSGIFSRIALKNPLADTSILGIQTGGTAFAMVIILLFPTLLFILPLFAFLGGLLAFCLTMIVSSKNGVNSLNLVLSGVAVNAFFTAIIGLLTIFNPTKLQSTLTYLNGSLANATFEEMVIICIYSLILLTGSFILIPVLKLLKLNDNTVFNLGKKPNVYRFIACIYSVFLASICVSFVGVISFIGIIIPSIAQVISKHSLKDQMILSMLLGGILITLSDLTQRLIFSPMEIPVGLIIGMISSPLFLIVLKRSSK